jgi:hypothetical protein
MNSRLLQVTVLVVLRTKPSCSLLTLLVTDAVLLAWLQHRCYLRHCIPLECRCYCHSWRCLPLLLLPPVAAGAVAQRPCVYSCSKLLVFVLLVLSPGAQPT